MLSRFFSTLGNLCIGVILGVCLAVIGETMDIAKEKLLLILLLLSLAVIFPRKRR